ncbi:hypothetical protein CHH80_22810 [Bacillus sp. 7504-2]|nr:hypothetical protein CHH80_22810 [Bacillus sp. 7504-2]
MVIFIDKNNYVIPTNIFSTNSIYLSYIYLGGYLDKDLRLSPSSGNAIAKSKSLTFVKAFAEGIERRSLGFGGNENHEGNVITWDLISQEQKTIPFEYTKYSIKQPYCIDTTGTSAHYSSTEAIKGAILELIEKNILFLFWYGKQGLRLPLSDEILKDIHFKMLINEGFEVLVFRNDDFYPLIAIVVIVHNNKQLISSGSAVGFSFNEVLEKALAEAYVIKWSYLSLNLTQHYSKEIDEHLSSFPIGNQAKSENYTLKSDISNILDVLPDWVSNMHIIFLKNTVFPRLKCVKAFSTDLNNHVPFKDSLNLNSTINKKTLKLSTKELKLLPECIVI